MVRISVLNDSLRSIYNAEMRGKRHVLVRPASKVIMKFLQVSDCELTPYLMRLVLLGRSPYKHKRFICLFLEMKQLIKNQ